MAELNHIQNSCNSIARDVDSVRKLAIGAMKGEDPEYIQKMVRLELEVIIGTINSFGPEARNALRERLKP